MAILVPATFTALPYSATELRDTERIFLAPGRSTSLIMQADAREDVLRQRSIGGQLAGFRFWLFSGHAIADDLAGVGEPALVLSSPERGEVNDGFLTASEIATLNIGAPELVLLSACQTVLGRGGEPVAGEGMVGLARAFLVAGAQSVVGSLWTVSDAAAAAFSREYFNALASGVDKYAALRQTKLKMRQSQQFQSPRDWAAFVIIGGRQTSILSNSAPGRSVSKNPS